MTAAKIKTPTPQEIVLRPNGGNKGTSHDNKPPKQKTIKFESNTWGVFQNTYELLNRKAFKS